MSRFGSFVIRETKEASRPSAESPEPSSGFIASLTGKPASRVVEGSLMEYMKSKRGPKSSQDRVILAESAIAKIGLSNEEKAVILSMIKRLPSTSPDDARRQHLENKKLGDTTAKGIAADANLDLSRPRITLEAEFKIYIAVLEKIYRVAPQPISWGVFTQMTFMKEIGRELDTEFMKVAPNLRDIMMKKAFANLSSFKIWSTVAFFRFELLIQALNYIVEKGGVFKVVRKGDPIARGRYAFSDFLSLESPPKTIPRKVEMGTAEGNAKLRSGDLTIEQVFSAAAIMNFRYGLQLPEVRRGRKDAAFRAAAEEAKGEIVNAMLSVIKLYDETTFDRFAGMDSIDLGSKAAFSQAYNEAMAFFAGTWRAVMIGLYGLSGGADTRSADSVVEVDEFKGDLFTPLKFKTRF